ncbi:MAG: ATP synthase F1 subunit gamma [Bacilli bacterium]
MSESLIGTRRRIQTVQSTEKITKAMKLVASVKYQKWKKTYEQSLPFATEMKETMLRTISSVDLSRTRLSQYLTSFSDERTLYVIVTSSLGLCGSYNYNIYRAIDPILKPEDEIVVIGQKGYIHYHNGKNKVYSDYAGLFETFTYDNVRAIRHFLFRLYREEKYKAIKLVYTHYKNSMTFVPTIETLAPMDVDSLLKEAKKLESSPIFEPNPNAVADLILPHYADSEMYLKLIESQLSEQASRRNAMETATDNADDMLSTLQIEYNKMRQTAITQEITEVVAGANAGKDKED